MRERSGFVRLHVGFRVERCFDPVPDEPALGELGRAARSLRGALSERGKTAQFLGEGVGRGFELAVGDPFGRWELR